MQIYRPGELADNAVPTSHAHIGGPIRQSPIVTATSLNEVRTSVIVFAPGSATTWHSHEVAQILHVLDGHGFVETEADGVVNLGAGDTVVAMAHERHRHGATDGESFTQLTCSLGITDWE